MDRAGLVTVLSCAIIWVFDSINGVFLLAGILGYYKVRDAFR